jgi:hypothetical protein
VLRPLPLAAAFRSTRDLLSVSLLSLLVRVDRARRVVNEGSDASEKGGPPAIPARRARRSNLLKGIISATVGFARWYGAAIECGQLN